MVEEEVQWAGAITLVEEVVATGAEAVRGEVEAAEEGEAEEDHESSIICVSRRILYCGWSGDVGCSPVALDETMIKLISVSHACLSMKTSSTDCTTRSIMADEIDNVTLDFK